MPDTSDELDAILLAHGADLDKGGITFEQAKQRLINWKNQAIRAEMLSIIGEEESENSDDYPFEYGKQYGRNELRQELRQQVISRYGAEDGGDV